MKRIGLAAMGGAAVILLGLVWATPPHRATLPPRVSLAPLQLMANGYDIATLTIDEPWPGAPAIVIEPARAATVEDLSATARVEIPGLPAARAHMTTALDPMDSAADGTPDFLRLDDSGDQQSFRRWFTFLAETQYFTPPGRRSAEIVDCAALIRYAYREALRVHDGNWATEARLPVAPGLPSAAKYQYPYTPLGAGLFRVKPGGFQPADLTTGGFAQFADAKTLQLRNTHFVTRDLARAQPGDLLFYRQDSDHMPFHSMIYLGASQIGKDAARYLVYHTGPGADGPGEIRRPAIDELRRFPEPEWRPLPDNPRFLGVYRWNILRTAS
jgi:hypothetical protein